MLPFSQIVELDESAIDDRHFGLYLVTYSDSNVILESRQIGSFDQFYDMEMAAQNVVMLMGIPIARNNICALNIN